MKKTYDFEQLLPKTVKYWLTYLENLRTIPVIDRNDRRNTDEWSLVLCHLLDLFFRTTFFVTILGDVPPATGRTFYGKTFYDLFDESAKEKYVRKGRKLKMKERVCEDVTE